MEQKVKIAIIGLVVLLFISLIVILQVNGSKQSLERQINQLTKENVNLSKRSEDALRKNRTFEEQINSLEGRFKKAIQEKEELQSRYELVDKAREELIEQLDSLKAEKAKAAEAQVQVQAPVTETETAPAPPQPPQTEEAYWTDVLKTKTDLQLQLENVRKELKSLQINNEQLQREKNAFELDITALKQDNEDLKRQIAYNQKAMDSLTAELLREKTDKSKVQGSLRAVKHEDIMLRRQLKGLNDRKVNLEKKVAILQARNTSLENRFSELEVLLNEKVLQIRQIRDRISSGIFEPGEEPEESLEQKQLVESKDSVELPPITVRPQEDALMGMGSAYIMGKVVAVNRGNNFVIVDFGEGSGIKRGDTFQAYRNNKPIASLEAIQTRNSIVACDIKKESVSIKIGDTVK